MKVVLLAGGYGTRISEESQFKPKPMIEIGEKPILWHIMKLYSHYGYSDFIICAGYKQHVVKEWFADYYLYNSDVTFNFKKENEMTVLNNVSEPWNVTIVDTGLDTMTGGRIKRVQKYVGNEPFLLTYGDGVSDVNIKELVEYHQKSKKMVTLTAVSAGQKFGILDIDNSNEIIAFREKNNNDGSMINAGFMVCNPELFQYLKDDKTILERYPLETIAEKGELMAYKHSGFWHCMDTKRDKDELETLWANNEAPWKVWE